VWGHRHCRQALRQGELGGLGCEGRESIRAHDLDQLEAPDLAKAAPCREQRREVGAMPLASVGRVGVEDSEEDVEVSHGAHADPDLAQIADVSPPDLALEAVSEDTPAARIRRAATRMAWTSSASSPPMTPGTRASIRARWKLKAFRPASAHGSSPSIPGVQLGASHSSTMARGSAAGSPPIPPAAPVMGSPGPTAIHARWVGAGATSLATAAPRCGSSTGVDWAVDTNPSRIGTGDRSDGSDARWTTDSTPAFHAPGRAGHCQPAGTPAATLTGC
jgi:hypothetical protein